jgi:hypothetical protein
VPCGADFAGDAALLGADGVTASDGAGVRICESLGRPLASVEGDGAVSATPASLDPLEDACDVQAVNAETAATAPTRATVSRRLRAGLQREAGGIS